MARNALLSALQAAMLAGAGGLQGSIQAKEREQARLQNEEERKRREMLDLVMLSREAVSPGPLATRAPAGMSMPEAKGPPPSSVIPLPTGGVDMAGAMRQLEQEERIPSGTTPITIGGQTLYIPTRERREAEEEGRALTREERAFQRQIELARTLQPLELARATAGATAGAIAAGRVRAGEATTEAKRASEATAKLRQESFNSLEAAGVPGVGPYNPNRRYEDEWASYIKASPLERGAGGAGGVPTWTSPTAATATQRGNEVMVGGKKFIVPNP